MIDEEVWLERGGQLFQEPIGHGCAREAELAHGAGVGCCKSVVVNEIVVKRRHQVQVGDLFRRDQIECLAGIEARQADESAANQ